MGKRIDKKPMIEYLEIDDTYYIKNDIVHVRLNEGHEPPTGTWDEVWGDVLKIIMKAKEYDETHNQSGIDG